MVQRNAEVLREASWFCFGVMKGIQTLQMPGWHPELNWGSQIKAETALLHLC